jgi:hypothetical protein
MSQPYLFSTAPVNGNLLTMKLFVSFDGDHIGRMVGRASLADNPEEVARLGQAIDRGNRIWASWAESHGGKVVGVGGDEGRLEIEADYLSELPGIREQYEGAVGSTCSVGVGTKLSEADRSLMAAKLQGGDRIQLYTEEVDEILAEAKEKTESEKLQDEYLNPDSGLQKAAPAMNAGSNAGFAGASRSTPAAPAAPTEGSEHSENEALNSQIANAPAPAEAPKPTAADFEQLFHQLAAAQKDQQQPAGKPSGVVDGVREQVVKVLQNVRANAPALEQMKQSNPEMYQSVVGVVQAMIAMARSAMGDGGQPQQEEEVQKAEGKVGRCKWKLGERRCQRTITGDYCHDHKDHWANKILRKDLMPGGKGDDASDSSFDPEQLAEGMRVEMEEHGLDEARAKEVAKDHLTEDPSYYSKMDKAALEAGKTGRHQVTLPVGSQVDPGPSAAHEGGELKVQDPATGKTKWRQVRAGIVMAPDGTPTSSRNPGG